MKCKICNKDFEMTIHNKIYCSQKCNEGAYNLRYPNRRKEISKRWRMNNPKRYLKVIHNYRNKIKGKIATRTAAMKWYYTPQGKIIRKIYRKGDVYKTHQKISYNKRKRELNFIPIMNNPFPEEIKIDWHHINNAFVIPMPQKIHRIQIGDRTKHRNKCNQILEQMNFNLKPFLK